MVTDIQVLIFEDQNLVLPESVREVNEIMVFQLREIDIRNLCAKRSC